MSLGHAYIVAGQSAVLPQLISFLKKEGIEVVGNPDVYVRAYKQFGVDDAGEIRDRAQSRSVHGQGRIFIIVAPHMTVEAQNALLKTIEEPSDKATFFFVVSSPLALLPTVRSRSQVLELTEDTSAGSVDASLFLAATPEKRLDMMKPLYQHDDDDERDVREAVVLLEALERKLGSRALDESTKEGLDAVYRARKYMMDKGSLLKALLEQVALLVPRV